MWVYLVAMTEADAERGDFIAEFNAEEDAKSYCQRTGAGFILDCCEMSRA